jgi:adenosylcobyric acid synthase
LAGDPQGPFIVGICGGCQLLGKEIADPERIESDVSQSEGLGLLGLDTRFAREKSLFRVEGKVIAPAGLCPGCPVIGYEVHQGHSIRGPGTMPWLRLQRHPGGAVVEDGAVSATGRVCGTYVHGLFDDARFGRALVAVLRRRRGLPELADQEWLSQREFWSRRYRRLGSWLADHCDLKPVVRALEL